MLSMRRSRGPVSRSLRPEPNWTSGYFEAEVVAALLGELGYQISSPAAREMSPDVFYPAVASGVVDVWANGWFPLNTKEFISRSTSGV